VVGISINLEGDFAGPANTMTFAIARRETKEQENDGPQSLATVGSFAGLT
jgi:hypothetical protein